MSRPSLILILSAPLLFSPLCWGAALDKYAPPVQQQALPYSQTQQRTARQPPDRRDIISEKQRQALETLRALPPDTQQRWISEFKTKAAEAAKRGQYSAAAYYQGIIEVWELENQ